MPAPQEVVAVENVNIPGSTSNVNAEKYEAMRDVLLKILPKKLPGLTQAEMAAGILPHLPQHLWPNGEKAMWWLKTVQLDLEAKRLVVRRVKAKPTHWIRA